MGSPQTMKLRSRRTKTAAGIAGLMLVAFPLAACGGTTTTSSSTDTVQAVATIDNLSAPAGEQTQITVDQDFFADARQPSASRPACVRRRSRRRRAVLPDHRRQRLRVRAGQRPELRRRSGPARELGSEPDRRRRAPPRSSSPTSTSTRASPASTATSSSTARSPRPAPTCSVSTARTLKPLDTSEGGTAILEGTTVYISDVAAGLLNDTYGTDAVTDQVLVGIAKITVNLPK